jgi:hypothetical protein
MVYKFSDSTIPAELFFKYSSTPSHLPAFASVVSPFLIGWLPPVGSISNAALQSSQLYAPQSPSRSGLITQT